MSWDEPQASPGVPQPDGTQPHQGYPPYTVQQQESQNPYSGPQDRPTAVDGGIPGPQVFTGFPFPAPPARKRTGLVIGSTVSAIVAMATGIGVYAALGGSNSPTGSTSALAGTSNPTVLADSAAADATAAVSATDAATTGSADSAASTITLPSRADGLVLLTDSVGTKEASLVRAGLSTGGAFYAHAEVGAYGSRADGGYRLVLVEQPVTNMSADLQSEMGSTPPIDVVKQIATQASFSGTQVESSTDPAAAISCGTLDVKGVKVLTCLWDDLQSFGLAYFYDSYYATGVSAAAHYTDQLRAAAEGG
jgi:hypothetical protein